eukprot:CAMPEP_0168392206 /NCGR_PEP_ID=MMETSP0228-20121227/18380_1 /TAXON_ID=133427 /ORGANISM="Protoceratium reticulatum, Strain CCCM 535 (=CCMP 1889)" /LENGTH=49 /DNA_ID= /DNA_START= /DNA_END= /DNA_ORIENTATION=
MAGLRTVCLSVLLGCAFQGAAEAVAQPAATSAVTAEMRPIRQVITLLTE